MYVPLTNFPFSMCLVYVLTSPDLPPFVFTRYLKYKPICRHFDPDLPPFVFTWYLQYKPMCRCFYLPWLTSLCFTHYLQYKPMCRCFDLPWLTSLCFTRYLQYKPICRRLEHRSHRVLRHIYRDTVWTSTRSSGSVIRWRCHTHCTHAPTQSAWYQTSAQSRLLEVVHLGVRQFQHCHLKEG